MPGAFTRGGPVQTTLTEMTPEEREAQFWANLKGTAASAADPMGLVTAFGPDSVSQALTEAQEGGSAGTNLFGSVLAPMGTLMAAPRATASALGLGAYFGGADSAEAGARKKKQAKAMEQPVQAEAEAEDEVSKLVKKWQSKDPALGALYSTYDDAKKASRANVKGVDKASADEVRKQAATTATETMNQIMARIEQLDPPKKTFQQRYGALAENWPKIQAGVGAGVGAILGAKGGLADEMLKYGPWKRTIKKYDKAMDPSDTSKFMMGTEADPVRAREAAERLKGFADKWGVSGKDKGSVAVPMAAGGVASLEVGMMPDAYNLGYAPQDSEDYARAKQRLSGPGEMLAAYGPMVGISSLGAGTAAKIFGGKDKGPALKARSEPALARLGEGDRAQRSQNFMKSVQDDMDLRNVGKPQPAPAAPATGVAQVDNRVSTPTKARKSAAERQAENTDANKALELALKQLGTGKKINLTRMKKVPAKRLAKIEKLIADARADAPNVPDEQLAKVLGGQASRGALKYGVAGGATGYSAILAERLAKMEAEKAQDEEY